MNKLAVAVNGSPSADLSAGWRRLRVTLGLADVEDTANLTLSRTAGRIQLPPRSAAISFSVNGASLGRFEVGDVAGDTRAGTLTLHCGSVDPESSLRQPRNRSWPGGPFSSIITAIAAWNEFLWPLVVANSADTRVLTVGISLVDSRSIGTFETTHLVMMASLLSMAPLVIAFVLLQRQFVQGLAAAGSKG